MNNKLSIYSETEKWCHSKQIALDAHKEAPSTNDLAKREAMQVTQPLKIYLADQQSAGRGRNQNTWSNTAPGDALLCTWSFYCPQHPQAITGPLIGLALYKALKQSFDLSGLCIKPPNDIYLHDKKIAGLLVETVQAGDKIRLIIGFGLNVFSHPKQVAIAGHMSGKKAITTELWFQFLNNVHDELIEGMRASIAAHLTIQQREELLVAINNNTQLKDKFTSISPFGDLTQKDNTISWREL